MVDNEGHYNGSYVARRRLKSPDALDPAGLLQDVDSSLSILISIPIEFVLLVISR